MTFIPENEEEKLETEEELPKEKVSEEKKSGGSSLNSLVFLGIIGVAIFAGRDYLTGVKEIPVLKEVLSEKGSPEEEADQGLRLTRKGDSEMKRLLAEFKEGFDKIPNTELMEAEVKRIIYSEDKSKLVIELDYLEQDSGQRANNDVIFKKDDFGRLVTDTDWLSQIKLHPDN